MNEHRRNNRFFQAAKEFKETILDFFKTTEPKISYTLVDRSNDNFTILKSPCPTWKGIDPYILKKSGGGEILPFNLINNISIDSIIIIYLYFNS